MDNHRIGALEESHQTPASISISELITGPKFTMSASLIKNMQEGHPINRSLEPSRRL
jgi:hypothetical protein